MRDKRHAFRGRAAAALRRYFRMRNRLLGRQPGAVLLRAVTPLVVAGMNAREAVAKLMRDLRRLQR